MTEINHKKMMNSGYCGFLLSYVILKINLKKSIMKTIFKNLSILFVLIAALSCSKDNNTPDPNITSGSANLGTFVGKLQVTDDPQTKLGYVFNTNVTVTTSGATATIKVTGNDGFDREFTGSVNPGSTPSSTMITINRQTKPVDKIAGSTLIISNNELAINVNLAIDQVVTRQTTTSATTLIITGKIQMLGTTLLKI